MKALDSETAIMADRRLKIQGPFQCAGLVRHNVASTSSMALGA